MRMGFPMGIPIPMGFPWEWEWVTKFAIRMGRNGNQLRGNGREWECKKATSPGHLYKKPARALATDGVFVTFGLKICS